MKIKTKRFPRLQREEGEGGSHKRQANWQLSPLVKLPSSFLHFLLLLLLFFFFSSFLLLFFFFLCLPVFLLFILSLPLLPLLDFPILFPFTTVYICNSRLGSASSLPLFPYFPFLFLCFLISFPTSYFLSVLLYFHIYISLHTKKSLQFLFLNFYIISIIIALLFQIYEITFPQNSRFFNIKFSWFKMFKFLNFLLHLCFTLCFPYGGG